MKIFLTGACGQVGTALRELAGGEHEFVSFDINEGVEQLGGVRGEMSDRDTIRRATEGCDAIIHTAALTGRHRDKASHAEFIETNVIGTDHLFAAAVEHGIRRVVVSSSLEVLCGRKWYSHGTAELHEDMPIRPTWIYSVTKAQVETLGGLYAREHGLEIAQLRYTNVRTLTEAEMGLELLSHGITSADAARANLLAVAKPGLRDEVFCVGPRTPLTVYDSHAALTDPDAVLEKYWPGSVAVLEAAGVTISSQWFWPVTRTEKIRLMLGWEPEDTFEGYLASLGWQGSGA